LRDKSSESFLQALSYVLRFYTRFNLTVKILRSDRESDLISNEVDLYLSNHKIVTQTSPSYGHYQNRAERAIQIVNKSIRTLLSNQIWVRHDVWSEVLNFLIWSDNANFHLVN
jgi:hypothetical protein